MGPARLRRADRLARTKFRTAWLRDDERVRKSPKEGKTVGEKPLSGISRLHPLRSKWLTPPMLSSLVRVKQKL